MVVAAHVAEAAPKRSNLVERLLTAAVLVPFVLWLLYLAPSWAFPVVAALTALGGVWELSAMVAPGHGLMRLWTVGATASVIATLWAGRVDPWYRSGPVAVCRGQLTM